MIYELRTYIAAPGKMEALLERFRQHTLKFFAKHGMTSIGYWTGVDEKETDHLIFVLRFSDLAQHDGAWTAFVEDPEWQAVRTASHHDGPLVVEVRSTLMNATDFSPIR